MRSQRTVGRARKHPSSIRSHTETPRRRSTKAPLANSCEAWVRERFSYSKNAAAYAALYDSLLNVEPRHRDESVTRRIEPERRLKIAISFFCFKPNTGGLQALAEQLAQHLQRRGHDVVVVTRAATRVPHGRDYLFFNEPNSTLKVKGVPVRPLKFSRFWLPVLWFLGKCVVRPPLQGLAVNLYQFVSRKSARNAFAGMDVIHHVGEAPPLNGFAAAAAAKYWKIPFVVSPTCHPHHVGDSSLDFRLYREADRLLVYTRI